MAGLEGMRLGAYELMQRIGAGGMAEVYRARQLSAFGREVAIKVIRAEFVEDATFRTRFLREAHAISRLSHPNILPLIEFGDENGTLYLVMPWVREGTLRDLLRQRNGPLPLEEAIPLFVQLCEAVQYAHEEGIIHRDIKPQNVLLQRRAHVLLTDFGIARDLAQGQVTTTGAGIGSVEYMPPEQALGQVTPRSDIYSLGVVLYQMLTGAVPFSGTSPLHILMRHANEPLPDPRQINPRLPAAAVQVIQTSMAKDPQQRYASAQAMGQALQQIRPDATPPAFSTRLMPPPITDLPTRQGTGAAPFAGTAPNELPITDQQTRRIYGPGSGPGETPPSGPPFGLPVPIPPGGTRPLPENQGQPPTPAGWSVIPGPDSNWNDAPTWASQDNLQAPGEGGPPPPPGAGGRPPGGPRPPVNRQPPPPRGRGPLIAALVAALLLVVAVSSIAYGYFGLGWLHPGGATKGIQQITPSPGTTLPSPSPTTPTVPTATPTQQPAPPTNPPKPPPPTKTPRPTTPPPTRTPTQQPTDTPSPSPTDTPTTTPSPTDTPTDTPTSSVPTATDTPSTPPTATPTP